MKILLLGFGNLKHMPYARFYLDAFAGEGQQVHLLWWNRDGKPEDCPAGVAGHEFLWPIEDDIPKFRKLRGFRAYRRFALDLLDRQKFDLLVVLHTLPGVLLYDRLIRDYRGRFIFDYRDVTYEAFLPYRAIVHGLVHGSRITFVSSRGFLERLPQNHKIHISHNLRLVPSAVGTAPGEGPIRIGFWGYIRHGGLNRKLIAALGNDARFELHYYGREQAIGRGLKDYAKQNGIHNVFFHGSYEPGDQDRFARETDLLHNLYSNTEAPSQRLAMTNKFYDGLIYGLPQLCMRDSYMGDLVEREGLGLACDPADLDFPDRVWAYCRCLNRETLHNRCRQVLDTVTEEYHRGRELLRDAVRE